MEGNNILEALGIKPTKVKKLHSSRPGQPVPSNKHILDRTNYPHHSVIDLTKISNGSQTQFMVRYGARNGGKRQSIILWGSIIGEELHPSEVTDPNYTNIIAREIFDKDPTTAHWYCGQTQKRRCLAVDEGESFKYRNRTFTRLTAAELAAFNGNKYVEERP